MAIYSIIEHGRAEWECSLPLPSDPLGKGCVIVTADRDLDEVPELETFLSDFILRYPQIWDSRLDALLYRGWDLTELQDAHTETRIDLYEAERFPPDDWDLTYVFEFPNDYIIELSLV